jgi:hypothetical protein
MRCSHGPFGDLRGQLLASVPVLVAIALTCAIAWLDQSSRVPVIRPATVVESIPFVSIQDLKEVIERVAGADMNRDHPPLSPARSRYRIGCPEPAVCGWLPDPVPRGGGPAVYAFGGIPCDWPARTMSSEEEGLVLSCFMRRAPKRPTWNWMEAELSPDGTVNNLVQGGAIDPYGAMTPGESKCVASRLRGLRFSSSVPSEKLLIAVFDPRGPKTHIPYPFCGWAN